MSKVFTGWKEKQVTKEEKERLRLCGANFREEFAVFDQINARIKEEAKASFDRFVAELTRPYSELGFSYEPESGHFRLNHWHPGVYVFFTFNDVRGRFHVSSNIGWNESRLFYGGPESVRIDCPVFPKKMRAMHDGFKAVLASGNAMSDWLTGKFAEKEKEESNFADTMKRLCLIVPNGRKWNDNISTEKTGSIRVSPGKVGFEFTLPIDKAEALLKWANENL